MFDISNCQKVTIPQGALYLGLSNENKSVGYLELNPHQSLSLHNRPAIEILTQVKGTCDMIVYKGGEAEVITLQEEESLTIEPEGTYHIHCNPYDKISLTYWEFDGDIREIIDDIRKGAEK